jgi:hypothetical protein
MQQNCAGNKQKSYRILGMSMFAAHGKAKLNTENVGGFLNLEVVSLRAVQVT